MEKIGFKQLAAIETAENSTVFSDNEYFNLMVKICKEFLQNEAKFAVSGMPEGAAAWLGCKTPEEIFLKKLKAARELYPKERREMINFLKQN